MSSIIKGQRIRSESKLEITNKNVYINIAPTVEDENLGTDIKEQEQNIQDKIKKANAEASMIIEEAIQESKKKADEIIQDGHKKIETESLIALEKAQEEGYAIGYEEGKLEAQALIAEGEQLLLDAKQEKQQILNDIEPEVIEMIVGICGKLIDEEISYNKDTILILIRKALGKVTSDTLEISIKVSLEDYDYVLENKDIVMSNTSVTENMQIFKDPNLAKGVCIVETPFGSIEYNVKEAFSEMEKQIRLICNKK